MGPWQELGCVDYSGWQLTGVALASTQAALIPGMEQEPKGALLLLHV